MAALYCSHISLADIFFRHCRRILTDAEEDQGLHAEELLLSDLQHAEPLGQQLHPHTVFMHAGQMHSLAERGGKDKIN